MVDQKQRERRFALIARAVTVRRWAIVPLLTLLFLCPTILYGRPYVFWDTEQYFHYGDQLASFAIERIGKVATHFVPQLAHTTSNERSAAATGARDVGAATESQSGEQVLVDQKSKAAGMALYGTRSPFYSLWLYAIARILGLWGIVVTQAAAVSWLVWRLATHVAREYSFAAATAIAALVTVGSSTWFFVGFVMPDVYAATGILSAALFFAYADQMSSWERIGVAALFVVSLVFHVTHMLTAIVVVAAGFAAGYFWRSETPWRRAAIATGIALAVAVVMQLSFAMAARTLLGAALKGPPFLTARIIADGPGRLYLDSACQEEAFFLCSYRQRDVRRADDFLWSNRSDNGLFSTLSAGQRLRIIDEEPRFVAATIAHYPIGVAKAIVLNAIEQFALIWPHEAWADPGVVFGDPIWRDEGFFKVAPFLNGCSARLGSCLPSIPELLVAAVVIATTLVSFGVIAVHFAMQIGRGTRARSADRAYQRAIVFSALIIVGLVVNAVCCGAISGPYPRYQARIVWLAVLAASVLELSNPIIMMQLRKRRAGWLFRRRVSTAVQSPTP